MVGAQKDLTFYPSLAHARHSNTQRSSFFKSLKKLATKFKSEARRSASRVRPTGLNGVEGETITLGGVNEVFEQSPSKVGALKVPKRKSGRGARSQEQSSPAAAAPPRASARAKAAKTPDPVVLNPTTAKSGKTPKIRSQMSEEFKTRCDVCIGIIYGKKVNANSTAKVDSRLRRECFNCGKDTDYHCFGCNRFLCFSAPKVDEKSKKKLPKYFSMCMPVLDESTGEPKSIDDGSGQKKFEVVTHHGMWTCYHAAHQKGWEAFNKLHRQDILELARGKRPRRNSFG